MSAVWSCTPQRIEARASLLGHCGQAVTIEVETCNYIFLTLEQARSLWCELGAVLQSGDRDAVAGAAIRELEDLRGLPHSEDLTDHPSTIRR